MEEEEEEEENVDQDAIDFAERERLVWWRHEKMIFLENQMIFQMDLFNKDEKSKAVTGDLYRTKIPWNLTFAHSSLTYRQ